MSAGKRLQRRRSRGWRKPEGAVVVSRPSRWGNPFRVGHEARDAEHAVQLFEAHVEANAAELVPLIREHLAGRDLLCWCPPTSPCHADYLLQVAAGDRPR